MNGQQNVEPSSRISSEIGVNATVPADPEDSRCKSNPENKHTGGGKLVLGGNYASFGKGARSKFQTEDSIQSSKKENNITHIINKLSGATMKISR